MYKSRSLTFAHQDLGFRCESDIVYLDIGNCDGNITSWRVCYYRPQWLEDGALKYAVYRKTDDGTQFSRVSNSFNFTLANGQGEPDSGRICDKIRASKAQFNRQCYNIPLSMPFPIQTGDVIGVCIAAVGHPSQYNEAIMSSQMNTVLPAAAIILSTGLRSRLRLNISANITTSK